MAARKPGAPQEPRHFVEACLKVCQLTGFPALGDGFLNRALVHCPRQSTILAARDAWSGTFRRAGASLRR